MITIELPRVNYFSYFSPPVLVVLFFLLFTYRYNKQQGILASMLKTEWYTHLMSLENDLKELEPHEILIKVTALV